MAEKSRFFDGTIDNPREYPASEFAEYFAALVTSGVFGEQLNSLEVSAHGTELKTIVATGRAFLQGHYYENDAPLELAHENPDPANDRIDRVVVRLDRANYTINAMIITGTPASSPVAPDLVRDEAIFDVPLALVRIKAGRSYIAADQVTDDREYARYQAKPAWYPPGQVPMEAWLYSVFKDQLTPQEVADIEANPNLMAIINAPNSLQPLLLAEKKRGIETRLELLDVKLKLDEKEVIEFLNKTGAGFYDLFGTTEYVDTASTTATVDTTAADVIFSGQQLLRLLPQVFSAFGNVELALYDKNRESFKIEVNVDNGTELNVTIPPGTKKVGDKFYYNGEVYTITGVREA